jgi:hypothetical protein
MIDVVLDRAKIRALFGSTASIAKIAFIPFHARVRAHQEARQQAEHRVGDGKYTLAKSPNLKMSIQPPLGLNLVQFSSKIIDTFAWATRAL